MLPEAIICVHRSHRHRNGHLRRLRRRNDYRRTNHRRHRRRYTKSSTTSCWVQGCTRKTNFCSSWTTRFCCSRCCLRSFRSSCCTHGWCHA